MKKSYKTASELRKSAILKARHVHLGLVFQAWPFGPGKGASGDVLILRVGEFADLLLLDIV
jgi:hypothetical protein